MTARDHPLYQRLLPAVADLAWRLGAKVSQASLVRLRQRGRMRQSATAPWVTFTARQTIVLERCGFEWIARCGPFGVVTVRDALAADTGSLDVRALGLVSVARVASSAELTRGEVMRYLAELAWAPDAILRNQDLIWREDGPERLLVRAGSGKTEAEVTLNLDADGRIAGAFAPDRGALIDGAMTPTPWRGTFSDYRLRDGRWLPSRGEVSWSGIGGEWVYWQGQLKTWERDFAHE